MSWVLVPLAFGVGCLWVWLEHNSTKVRSRIDGLPARKRRPARVLFVLVVFAVVGFTAWVQLAADNVSQEIRERESLVGGVPIRPGQP